MAKSIFDVDLSKLGAAERILANMGALGPTMSLAADELRDGLPRNIDAVTSPGLSERYARRKAKLHPGKGLLRADDALYGSFQPGHSDDEAWAGPVGIVYAAAQNYGFENLPGREFMYIDEPTGDRVFGMICDAVTGWGAA